MSQQLTTRMLSAFAKLNLNALTHAQKLEALAKAAGFSNYASFKASCDEKSAELSVKPQVPAETFTTIVAFGMDLTHAISENLSLYDKHGYFIGGDLQEHTFETAAEIRAYHQGLSDMEGWMDSATIVSQDNEPDHPYFSALRNNPKLTYERYYEADRKSAEALDDGDIDENVIGYQVINPATNEIWDNHPSSTILSMETAQKHINAALRAGKLEFEVRRVRKGEIEDPSFE